MTEEEITRIAGLLEERTDEYRKLAVEAAHAEVAYKRSYAVEFLRAEGPVAQREATAVLKADEEHAARKATEAVRDACLESMRSLRAQLSSCQSLLRAELGQGG